MQTTYLTKNLYLEYIKISQNSKVKKPNNLLGKLSKDINRYYTTKEIQIIKTHTERCSTLLVIKKMQSKTTRYHYTSVRITKLKK